MGQEEDTVEGEQDMFSLIIDNVMARRVPDEADWEVQAQDVRLQSLCFAPNVALGVQQMGLNIHWAASGAEGERRKGGGGGGVE